MNKHRFSAIDVLLLLLVAACVTLGVMVALLRPFWLVWAGGILLVALVVALVGLRGIRRRLRRLLSGPLVADAAEQSGLSPLQLPVAAIENDTILWYNDAFAKTITGGKEAAGQPISHFVPDFRPNAAALPEGQQLRQGDKRYNVYCSATEADETLAIAVFVENTHLQDTTDEYAASRPAVIFFLIDTYDEILKNMRETDRSRITADIDSALERYVGGSTGFLRKISTSRYLAVVEERHLTEMIAGRFDILDAVRQLDEEASSASLSIGVGRGGATLKECEERALQALDMALGRGGDQAAVRGNDGFEFYGGVSRSVEKRTRIKSRIMAAAIKDLMEHCDRVLIMGHKNSDMDSIGAAVGMLRFCRICRKPAAIVLDGRKTHADSLYRLLIKNGYSQDILNPDQAKVVAGRRTLLVVVDTHMKNLLESTQVYEECELVVVIDHHRKMVGHIDNAVLFYQESSASSTCEMVAELLQYAGDSSKDRPTAVEADALLAGIMLDTRTFSLNVGVRTFEAAAWLRRMGAETGEVKKLFSSTKEEYVSRSQLVSQAKIYKSCAVVVSNSAPADSEVVIPQAANDLLTIDQVKASIVAVRQGHEIRVSARSMGDINVQLIMEKLGGGGHQTMAGAQLKEVDTEDAERMILAAIEEYHDEHSLIVTSH